MSTNYQTGMGGYANPVVLSPEQQVLASRFVSRTYGWMFLGLMFTAIVSLATASSQTAIQYILVNRWVFYGLMFAELGLVFWLSASQAKLSPLAATLGFLAYSGLNGLTLSVILLAYTMSSVANVFFISSAMFGGLALFGAVTKKDLTGLGAFVGMGLWGIILVGLVNMFIRSDALSSALGLVGVVVFAGLTAYDSQRIRAMAYSYSLSNNRAAGDKGAVFGALMLYLNFINLFLSLLRLFGDRRR